MPPGPATPIRLAVCRVSCRVRCRSVVWPMTIAVCLAVIAASIPHPSAAADRNEARFRRLLTGRHDEARVAALRSVPSDFQSRLYALPIVADALETLCEDARFDRAMKQGQPELPGGVRLMIDFIGTIDRPEATASLVDLLDCGRLTWAMASIQTLCKHQHHTAIEDVIGLIDSEAFEASYGFRFTLARGLTEMKHPDAWEGLAKLFERVDGQLAHRLDQEFQRVTSEDFEGDEERFQAWRGLVGLTPAAKSPSPDALDKAAEILRQDGKPELPLPQRMGLQPAKSAASYAREKRLKPSHYYGINIYAKRLLFVIDRSGSMKTVVGGHARIQRAKMELITAINGLDEQCQFGILVFDNDVRAWREELVEANETNKRNAIRFVEYLSAGRSTNTYAALRRSLNFDPQLEAVFLLTDGEPTYGQVVNPSAILLDILRRNEVHNVTINTIAIAVEPLMATFLRNLSEPSNGEFREVR
ncbi:von Willebrand factor type A domain protein [Stieleria neptunia]|uniref:von Willebrand factor type A domain protein n=1 Tax=Stieleria neptunia TaxID=2527979 RepID=A0A518I1Q1_9BACT|nr:VWA domain-containing protein [Stieleria neptunia]QDV46986.1 von Willebrand factor type A domain protein [Stieleria neptunia]